MDSKKNLLTIVLTSLLFVAFAVLPAIAQDDPYADFTFTVYEEPDSSPEARAKFAELKKAAESGDAEAQTAVGRAYKDGAGTQPDQEQAIFWIKKAAEQNEPEALYRLGGYYLLGYGVPADKEMALAYLNRAAALNYAKSRVALALLYLSGKHGIPVNKARGLELLRALANSRETPSDVLCVVGGIFLIEKQCVDAERCLLPLAEQGVSGAQKLLLTYCLRKNDFRNAAKWCRLAAEQGDAEAKKNLPELERMASFYGAENTKQDMPATRFQMQEQLSNDLSLRMWAESGSDVVRTEPIAETFTLDSSPEAKEKFAKWEKAASQYLAQLSGCYFVGYGVPADKEKALAFLEKAAEMKHEYALTILASLYISGKYGVPVDKEKGLALLRSAVNSPNATPDRLLSCGILFMMEKQYADAKKCLLPLAEQGNLGAQKAMMMCCASENDVRNAAEWCRRAAEQGDADAKAALPKFEEALKNREQAESAAVPAPQEQGAQGE